MASTWNIFRARFVPASSNPGFDALQLAHPSQNQRLELACCFNLRRVRPCGQRPPPTQVPAAETTRSPTRTSGLPEVGASFPPVPSRARVVMPGVCMIFPSVKNRPDSRAGQKREYTRCSLVLIILQNSRRCLTRVMSGDAGGHPRRR